MENRIESSSSDIECSEDGLSKSRSDKIETSIDDKLELASSEEVKTEIISSVQSIELDCDKTIVPDDARYPKQPGIFEDLSDVLGCNTDPLNLKCSQEMEINNKHSSEHLVDVELSNCQSSPSYLSLLENDMGTIIHESETELKSNCNSIRYSELVDSLQSEKTTLSSVQNEKHGNEHLKTLNVELDSKIKESNQPEEKMNSNADLSTGKHETIAFPEVKATEIEKSNVDLKEKIGSSIKSMFDNNDHLNLNLLEKQNIANLQTNTLKKVNNLFSTFKSYNFSNFRNNEENSSKDKTSPVDKPKDIISDHKEKIDQKESRPNSFRPVQNSQNITLANIVDSKEEIQANHSNSISTLAELNSNLVNNTIEEQNTTAEESPRLNPSDLKSVRDQTSSTSGETNDSSKVLSNEEETHKIKNLVTDPESAHEDLVRLRDSFTVNTDLIHTVRNASHVKNKSISLNSSPVRQSDTQHALQDELYLLKETNIRLLGEISW